MPLTKQQIAIKCHYEGRHKPKRPPRDHMVLDGRVKLTPRRREILFHVACTDDLQWRIEPDWSYSFRSGYIFQAYLGGVGVAAIIQYLKRQRLIRLAPGSIAPDQADLRLPKHIQPVLIITARGMDALLEITGKSL